MPTAWLPHSPLAERRLDFGKIRAAKRVRERLHLSEFLQPSNILFFKTEKERNIIADALLKTLQGFDLPAARRAIWQRDGDLSLRVAAKTSILRGRLSTLHHLQAALAIAPSAETPIQIVFIGPVDQNRLHAGMLVAISSIFCRPSVAQSIARLKKPEAILHALRQAENTEPWKPSWPHFLKNVWEFFRLRYAGIPPSEEVS